MPNIKRQKLPFIPLPCVNIEKKISDASLVVRRKSPSESKKRSANITRSRNSKQKADFKAAAIIFQDSSVALTFFQLADSKSSASFLLQSVE